MRFLRLSGHTSKQHSEAVEAAERAIQTCEGLVTDQTRIAGGVCVNFEVPWEMAIYLHQRLLGEGIEMDPFPETFDLAAGDNPGDVFGSLNLKLTE